MIPKKQHPEDTCPKAAGLRKRYNGFNKETYETDYQILWTDFEKANQVLQSLLNYRRFFNEKSPLTKVLNTLSATINADCSIYKTLFSQLPDEILDKKKLENRDFFRMKDFKLDFESKTVIFKPLFALEEVRGSVYTFIAVTIATKMILILLQITHLDYWAARFYKGLGSARLALLLSMLFKDLYEEQSLGFALLHHTASHTLLIGIGVLLSEKHRFECNCIMEMLDAHSATAPQMLTAFSKFGQNFHRGNCDKFLKETTTLLYLYSSCLSFESTCNKSNILTIKLADACNLSEQVLYNQLMINNDVKPEMAQKTVREYNAINMWYRYFDYRFVQAMKFYVVGCYFGLAISTDFSSRARHCAKQAEENFTFVLRNLSTIDPSVVNKNWRYHTLYNKTVTASTVLKLRNYLLDIHDPDPEHRLQICNSLLNLRNTDLKQDGGLDPGTADKLVAAASLVNLYLSDTINTLMSHKNGKHRNDLRRSIRQAKKQLRKLLKVRANESFCRLLLTDLIKHRSQSQYCNSSTCYDLDPIIIIVKGLAIMAGATEQRKTKTNEEHSQDLNDGKVKKKTKLKKLVGKEFNEEAGEVAGSQATINGHDVDGSQATINGHDVEGSQATINGHDVAGSQATINGHDVEGSQATINGHDVAGGQATINGHDVAASQATIKRIGKDGCERDWTSIRAHQNPSLQDKLQGCKREHEKEKEEFLELMGESAIRKEVSELLGLVKDCVELKEVARDLKNLLKWLNYEDTNNEPACGTSDSDAKTSLNRWDMNNNVAKKCHRDRGAEEKNKIDKILLAYRLLNKGQLSESEKAKRTEIENGRLLTKGLKDSTVPWDTFKNKKPYEDVCVTNDRTNETNKLVSGNTDLTGYCSQISDDPISSMLLDPTCSDLPNDAFILEKNALLNYDQRNSSVPSPPDLSNDFPPENAPYDYGQRNSGDYLQCATPAASTETESTHFWQKGARSAMEYLFRHDFLPSMERLVWDTVIYTRATDSLIHLKKLACRHINKVLMNEDLLARFKNQTKSESTNVEEEETLSWRLEEALRILCEANGDEDKILHAFVEASDVLGIRTVYDV